MIMNEPSPLPAIGSTNESETIVIHVHISPIEFLHELTAVAAALLHTERLFQWRTVQILIECGIVRPANDRCGFQSRSSYENK
jgi:hypothetical protein